MRLHSDIPSENTDAKKEWAQILEKLDPKSRALGLIGFLAEALFVAALFKLPPDQILYALMICAGILVFVIAGIVGIERLSSRSSGQIAAGVTPSAKTPDTKLLNQLVNGAIETVCRAVSIPETPESAGLRVFIFRKDGTQLTCSHFWAANPAREVVNRLHFEINSGVAMDVAVVQAAIDEKITRSKVKPLPAHMKRVTGEVEDKVEFVLAAPIRKADGSIWGIVDFDADSDKGRNLLLTQVADAALFQLALHLQVIFSMHSDAGPSTA